MIKCTCGDKECSKFITFDAHSSGIFLRDGHAERLFYLKSPKLINKFIEALSKFAIDINLTTEQWKKLSDHRSGCSCHINPPCSNCSNPISFAEAVELGFIDEHGKEQVAA